MFILILYRLRNIQKVRGTVKGRACERTLTLQKKKAGIQAIPAIM
jgi:hypothetical protein